MIVGSLTNTQNARTLSLAAAAAASRVRFARKCWAAVFGGAPRQAIVEEWARAVKDFHATLVHVVDDVFFHYSPEFDAVIRGLDREGVPQQAIFSANIHVNLVKRDVIRRAKAVGCKLINIGIESGDDDILRYGQPAVHSEEGV